MRIAFSVVVIAGFLSIIGSPQCSEAQEPDPQPLSSAVWGLSSGDRFVVGVSVVKQTEITVDEGDSVVADTRDRFEIEYRVVETRKNGDLVIAAQMKRAAREVSETSPASIVASARTSASLDDLSVKFLIDSTGQILSLDVREKESVFAALSGLDSATTQLLKKSCPDETIIAWFGRPFWTARTLRDASSEPQRVPDRQDSISMGPFGTLQTTVIIEPAKDGSATEVLSVTGKSRFVPLVVPEDSKSGNAVSLTSVTAQPDLFSGNIRMTSDGPAEENITQARIGPDFQSLELNVRFHGEGTMVSSGGGRTSNVRFRQTQMQMWVVIEVVAGRSDLYFGIPGPADVP